MLVIVFLLPPNMVHIVKSTANYCTPPRVRLWRCKSKEEPPSVGQKCSYNLL